MRFKVADFIRCARAHEIQDEVSPSGELVLMVWRGAQLKAVHIGTKEDRDQELEPPRLHAACDVLGLDPDSMLRWMAEHPEEEPQEAVPGMAVGLEAMAAVHQLVEDEEEAAVEADKP